jgi:hypothetical protein
MQEWCKARGVTYDYFIGFLDDKIEDVSRSYDGYEDSYELTGENFNIYDTEKLAEFWKHYCNIRGLEYKDLEFIPEYFDCHC